MTKEGIPDENTTTNADTNNDDATSLDPSNVEANSDEAVVPLTAENIPAVSGDCFMEELKRKVLARAKALIRKCDIVLKNSSRDLDDARSFLEPVGLTVDSSVLDSKFTNSDLNAVTSSMSNGAAAAAVMVVLRTTAGYSNTDHVVQVTGDPRKDRLEELKRNYQRRARLALPESRSEFRWDKPKIPGERRRRILRDKDLPQAPPEPPLTGYVIFVSQMTIKVRHDRPDEPHQQTKVVQEISKIWRYGMSEDEREYYNSFAQEAQKEYQRMHCQYRATGKYTPSDRFEKLQGVGPWVRIPWHEKNALERELATYECISFPPRPPTLDDAYEQRRLEGIRKRRIREAEQARQVRETRSVPVRSRKKRKPIINLDEDEVNHENPDEAEIIPCSQVENPTDDDLSPDNQVEDGSIVLL
jgi:HMG (high mobility group) box